MRSTLEPPDPAVFLITIDTEGDNVWARPAVVETRNAAFLPRFQSLCDRFHFKPTYLTNWEMASLPAFCEFAADGLRRSRCGIGMHLHGWDSPPIAPLTENDAWHQPYLTEYPEAAMRAKVERVTGRLEDTFGMKMTSHRAGRWGFDSRYARILLDNGFKTDCSVTPHVSWRQHPGNPAGMGGPDYRAFPTRAYRFDHADIAAPTRGPLLEVPMTIMDRRPVWPKRVARQLLGKTPGRVIWLRPNGRNLDDMLWIIQTAVAEKRPYIQFTLHSSEFMPGGSPTFETEKSIETLYDHMTIVFEAISRHFIGKTLDEYSATYTPP